MRFVVDSNIVFSAILNPESKIGQIIINGSKYFDFITINQLKNEIHNHTDKILKISGLTPKEFQIVYEQIISKIKFIDDELINETNLTKAVKLTRSIDPDDSSFLGLAIQFKFKLWTGDKKLSNGLKEREYTQIISTD